MKCCWRVIYWFFHFTWRRFKIYIVRGQYFNIVIFLIFIDQFCLVVTGAVVLIVGLKDGCFLRCVKLVFKLFQFWSIGLDPVLSECPFPPENFSILEGRKCLQHTTAGLVTLKPSLLSRPFITAVLLSCTSLLFHVLR